MDGWDIFLWGFCGSVAADVVRFRQSTDAAAGRLPALYRRPHFYVGAVLLAIVSGFVAIASGANNRLLAFQVGLSTPLIVHSLIKKPPTLPPSA